MSAGIEPQGRTDGVGICTCGHARLRHQYNPTDYDRYDCIICSCPKYDPGGWDREAKRYTQKNAPMTIRYSERDDSKPVAQPPPPQPLPGMALPFEVTGGWALIMREREAPGLVIETWVGRTKEGDTVTMTVRDGIPTTYDLRKRQISYWDGPSS